MSDNKVTLDQLDSSAIEAMSSSVGDVNMLNTENKTIVGALAEIVGKKEIANAIGEPLVETDKFTEMSSEINGLLSTFKTNMMNAGVVVESGDKFKQLIEKIKGLTEGEGNKGIQYAEGSVRGYSSNTNIYDGYTIEANFGFTPTILFVQLANFYYNTSNNYSNIIVSNISNLYNDSYGVLWIESFDDTYFTLKTPISSNITVKGAVKWYAIGVGEEDTTLRDSLASILENKGVDVTEEDDIASLITKVEDMDTIISNEPQVLCYTESCVEYTFESTVRGDDYFDVFIKDNYAYFIVQDSHISSSYLVYNAKAIKYDLVNKVIVNEVVIFENYDYRRRVADSYLINDEIILFVDFGIYSLKLNDLSITNLYRNTNTDPAAPNIIKTDDYIYCATGGYNNEDDPLIYRYNITSRKVDKTASLPRATYNSSYRNYRIYFLGFDKLNGYLYVSGGGYTYPITQFDLELKTIVSVDLYDTTAAYSTYNSRYAFGNNNIISWLGYSNGNYLQFFTMDITNVESTFTKTPVNFPCNINCIYSGNMNYTEKPEIPCIGFTDQYMYIKCNDSFIRVDTTTKSLEYVPIPIYFKKFRIIDDETIECPTPAGLYRLKIKQI